MNTSIPSLKFSLKLLSFLLIPYFLKWLFTEPYPAIIFPSGHHRLNVKKSFIVNREYLLHVYSDQNKIEVTPKRLFPNVPEQYYEYIINNNLGFYNAELTSLDSDDLNQNLFPWQDNKRLKQNELKKYYEENLEMSIDSIKLYIIKNKRDKETGSLINQEVVSVSNFVFK